VPALAPACSISRQRLREIMQPQGEFPGLPVRFARGSSRLVGGGHSATQRFFERQACTSPIKRTREMTESVHSPQDASYARRHRTAARPATRPRTSEAAIATRPRCDLYRDSVRPHLLQCRKVNLSHVFAGQNVGVTQVGDRVWLVTFMRYDLGYFDDETCRLEPIENPFAPKLLPMSPE